MTEQVQTHENIIPMEDGRNIDFGKYTMLTEIENNILEVLTIGGSIHTIEVDAVHPELQKKFILEGVRAGVRTYVMNRTKLQPDRPLSDSVGEYIAYAKTNEVDKLVCRKRKAAYRQVKLSDIEDTFYRLMLQRKPETTVEESIEMWKKLSRGEKFKLMQTVEFKELLQVVRDERGIEVKCKSVDEVLAEVLQS